MKNLYLTLIFSFLFYTIIYSQGGWYWQNPYPQGNALRSVSFLASVANRGWAVGELGTAIYTEDAGVTWQLVDLGTTENLNCVFMHSDTQVFIVGENGLIIYIYDDGSTFELTFQTSNTTENLRSITSHVNDCLWIVGDNGTILRSTDMGDTWVIMRIFIL